ncbi:hypothetical protein IG631_18383 [Alternaria alternata]|nr:hypothetical protein IG631_18383 [Alternaria alternata]
MPNRTLSELERPTPHSAVACCSRSLKSTKECAFDKCHTISTRKVSTTPVNRLLYGKPQADMLHKKLCPSLNRQGLYRSLSPKHLPQYCGAILITLRMRFR